MFRSRSHAAGASAAHRVLAEDWLAWAAVLCVFAVDSLTPTGFGVGVLYVAVVALSTISERIRTMPLGVASSVAVLIGLATPTGGVPTPTDVLNRGLSIGAIWAVVAVAGRLGATTDDLNDSRARMAHMVAEIDEYAIIALDTNGRVAEWNRGAARIKGYRAEDIIGRSFEVFHPVQDRDAGVPARLLAHAREEGTAVSEGWRVRADGSRFWATITITAFHDNSGTVRGFSKITRDLTQKRTTQAALTARTDQLEAANDELEQFVYTAAHDLQAPIRTISGYVHLINEAPDHPFDGRLREYLDRIVDSTARMSQLLNDLLGYARIGWDAEPEAVDLGELIDDVIGDVLRSDRDDVDIEIAALPTVMGHPTYLRLALRNLVDNAVKYAKPDEPLELRIGAEQADGTWVVSVADNGIGFSDRVRDRVFSVFQRLPNTAHIDGSGIGLAHCRKIARMHRGDAWAESAPGEGSTFYLSVADTHTSRPPTTVG